LQHVGAQLGIAAQAGAGAARHCGAHGAAIGIGMAMGMAGAHGGAHGGGGTYSQTCCWLDTMAGAGLGMGGIAIGGA